MSSKSYIFTGDVVQVVETPQIETRIKGSGERSAWRERNYNG